MLMIFFRRLSFMARPVREDSRIVTECQEECNDNRCINGIAKCHEGCQHPAMCQHCDSPAPHARRHFLKLAAGAVLGLGLAGRASAAPQPPRPQNAIPPDAALDRLLKGNDRYVSGNMKSHDFPSERPALALGQNPFAGILSCADSRVAPEYAFDTGRGDLFVCRVAGNFANADTIASFEYAVAVLNVPFILVLGHMSCGAVDSTIKAVKDGAKFPGHIPSLIKALKPAVKNSLDQPGDLLLNATKENVRLTAKKLGAATPILQEAVAAGRLKIAGGIYNLTTGRVELLA
jgi:carbonic anhydrase